MIHSEITPMLHLAMIIFVIVFVSSISIIGIHIKSHGYLNQFSSWLGISLLCLWLVYNTYYLLPSNFKLDVSLPLHVCDILAIIAATALLKPNRKTSALLYFCALLMAGQAIMTPIGDQNPLRFRFWLFWLLHAGIISASIYDLLVRKYRPIFKDYLFVIGCDIIYVIVILPLDILFDWNYGYIGNQTPDTATLINLLGIWPQRLLWMLVIVFIAQLIIYLPWKIFKQKV